MDDGLTNILEFGKIRLTLEREGLVTIPQGAQMPTGARTSRMQPLFRVDLKTRAVLLKTKYGGGEEVRIGEVVALKMAEDGPEIILSLALPITREVKIV